MMDFTFLKILTTTRKWTLNIFLVCFLLLLCTNKSFAQAGKDGALTVTVANTVLNRYTRVTADVLAGSNTVTVTNIAELNRDAISYLPAGYVTNAAGFASNTLVTGDLIMLYQAQGATINSDNTINYGDVTNYNNAGSYELAYVSSVAGNVITLSCNTRLSYYAARYVQVIRIPQYTTLTVTNPGTIVATPWGAPTFGGADPSAIERRKGGLVGILADNIVNNGSINANEAGFRGGTRENSTSGAGAVFYTDFRTTDAALSAEKGEGIAGYRTDYDTSFGGRYGRGAAANGGGGGNAHNAGGGGGANGGDPLTWFRGAGVMNDFGTCGTPGAWALDPNYIANGNTLTNSSGGGSGGYTYAGSDQNACTVGPSYPAGFISAGVPAAAVSNAAWGGDYRDAVGGLGGRPLTSTGMQSQIFFGGGGGAGDGNNNASADGGDGGGIVFLIVANDITGSGTIQANGQNGANTIGGHNDAPGGGGGGGTVLIEASTLANTINANGGSGGRQLAISGEAEGPGGGGGGGVISIKATTDSSVKTITGGANGYTDSTLVTEFRANGATSGNSGSILAIAVTLNSSVCQTDLQVGKTVNNATPNVGDNVTFTITATNNGTSDATGVSVSDVLPSGYTFVSATLSTGTWSAPNWTIGNLANGASATLSIVATVNASGSYSNTATITGNEPDPTPVNNTSTTVPVPVAQSDLSVVKTASNATPNVGDNITFTITATNNGASDATGVSVSDVLPSGYTFVSATPSTGTWSAPNWAIGNLANGASATLSIVATVNASGSYSNTATITGNEPDPTPVNNTSTTVPVPVSVIDANDDSVTITSGSNGEVAIIDVFTNDTLNGNQTDLIEVTLTINTPDPTGHIILNPDGTVDIVPGTPAGTYQIIYSICEVLNSSNCSTAVVTVVVNTINDLEPYTHMTANSDGNNDVFYIDGITKYPNNTVEIYNRWGVLVYQTKEYNNANNSFDGKSRGRTTVNANDNLPEGTYYYIIRYTKTDGEKREKSGYLYLNR